MSHRLHTLSLAISAALAATLPTTALAERIHTDVARSATAFQDPTTAPNWGGWTRGDPETLWASWDLFNSTTDRHPDIGQHNVRDTLFMAVSPGTFLSGTRNLYSFTTVNEFTSIIRPTQLDAGPRPVAVQIAVMGSNIDHQSLTLNGQPWTSRSMLRRGQALLPPGHPPTPGGGGGVDNEYLFLWSAFERADAREPLVFDLRAAALHNSLAAFSVDVGPVIPLPAAVWLLAPAVAGLGLATRRRGT